MGANTSTNNNHCVRTLNASTFPRVKPSTTINNYIPIAPAPWKVSGVPPNEKNKIYGIKNQTAPFSDSTYAPECQNCNSSGCNFGECSIATKWDDCSLNSGKMMDATFDPKLINRPGGTSLEPWWFIDHSFPRADFLDENVDNILKNATYTPEGGDYTAYYQNCFCSTKPVCARPNTRECHLGRGSGGDEPTWRADWSEQYSTASTKTNPRHKLRCIWDLSKIDSVDQISKYVSTFNPAADDPEYAKIMTQFCAVKSTNCLVDPTTNLKIGSCSRVTAHPSDPASGLCRNWFEGASNAERDAFIYNVCSGDTENRAECKCYNRAGLVEYQAVANVVNVANGGISFEQFHGELGGQPIEDGCWYLPCKKSSPAFLVDSGVANPRCPSQICQQIISASHTGGNVDIQNNQNILNCTFTQNDFDNTKTPTATDLPDLPPISIPLPVYKPPQQLGKQSYIGIIIVIILFLATLFVLFPLVKKKLV